MCIRDVRVDGYDAVDERVRTRLFATPVQPIPSCCPLVRCTPCWTAQLLSCIGWSFRPESCDATCLHSPIDRVTGVGRFQGVARKGVRQR